MSIDEGWTNLWRLFVVRSGNYHHRVRKLHEKYGPVVRIGPNLLDLDYPELIKTVYGTDESWLKTEFYHNNSVVINGKIVYNVFSTTDPVEHNLVNRPIIKYLSISSILGLEPLMDKCITELCDELDTRFAGKDIAKGKLFDLGEWIGYCAWDLITTITFSHPYGYMKKGHDFDNSIGNLAKTIDYFSAVGQMPFLDFLLDKNPIIRLGPPNIVNVTLSILKSIAARQQGKDDRFDPAVPDLLQHFLEAKTTHPDTVDDNTIVGYMMIPLVAGADTTAITICAIFYFLLRHPETYRKLETEILAAGFPKDKPISYAATRSLP
ncbi:cytochrome P450 monooxygenase mpaDE, partial [Staphylotrichum tortipilum]